MQAKAETSTPVANISRRAAARILGVSRQQIVAWQHSGLLRAPASQTSPEFSLRDLTGMRRLRELRGSRASARSARRSLRAMQHLFGLDEPLHQSATLQRGTRLLFRHGGVLLDPLTQQFALDFEPEAAAASAHLRPIRPAVSAAQQSRTYSRAQDLFQQAVQLEEGPDTVPAAADLYREVLALWPTHAPASVNLGTILYNVKRYPEAEACYRLAAEIDPDYALAFFDLGNVLDELQRLPEAVAAYTRALQIVPNYADAHYNLALAYERLGERRRALRHWLHYVRLDPTGPWSAHARAQAKKALASEKLSIVSRFGRLAS